MKTEKDIKTIEEQVVDKLEQPTDSDYAHLADDADALDVVQTINDVKDSLYREQKHVDVDEAWQNMRRKVESQEPDRRRNRMMAIVYTAAAAVAAIALVFMITDRKDTAPNDGTILIVQNEEKLELERNGTTVKKSATARGRETVIIANNYQLQRNDTSRIVLNVPQGQTTAITLPDGSKAYLHTGSQIVFPAHFSGKERWVELKGEAYFVVTHDADHPFVVRTNKMETKVLGTEFNIDSNNEKDIRVTLITGKVAVSANGKAMTLSPGLQASVTDNDIETQAVDTEKYTNWRDGYFYFDNMTLADILTEIGKEYGLSVTIANEDARKFRAHFVVPRTLTISNLIDQINKMHKVKVSINEQKELVVE